MNPGLTVIIPTFNEEDNIGKLCKIILKMFPQTFIIVVDDGSEDKTQEIVLKLAEMNPNLDLLNRKSEKVHGLSISIADAIHVVKTENFMVMDADFQHPPESLEDALQCFKQEPALVIGRRDHVENWTTSRKIISWGAQVLGKIVLSIKRQQKPSDLMTGFFGGKQKLVGNLLKNEVNLQKKGYKILFDILKVFPKDEKIVEFGYTFRDREHGVSKIGKTQIFAFLRSLILGFVNRQKRIHIISLAILNLIKQIL